MFQCFTTLALKQRLGPYLPFAWSVTLRKWYYSLERKWGRRKPCKKHGCIQFLLSIRANVSFLFFFYLKSRGGLEEEKRNSDHYPSNPLQATPRIHTAERTWTNFRLFAQKHLSWATLYRKELFSVSARFIKIISFIRLELKYLFCRRGLAFHVVL